MFNLNFEVLFRFLLLSVVFAFEPFLCYVARSWQSKTRLG